jgi:hypothetical protein
MDPDDLDLTVVESAERELEEQLVILQSLKRLHPDSRRRVLEAIGLILEADKRVPGIFEAVGKGLNNG